MKELFISLLPVISSVVAVVVTSLGFIVKVKTIIGDKDKTNKALKKELEDCKRTEKVVIEKLESSVVKQQMELDALTAQNTQLWRQNEELKECTKKVTELVNTENTIKTQLTVLLKEGNEHGESKN